MQIPDPATTSFPPAPPGQLRLVAWRHRTQSWPDPELTEIHRERATLLHWWAETYKVDVDDWGNTDDERPAEHADFLMNVGATLMTEAIVALATMYVKRFLDRKKEKKLQSQSAEAGPNVRPLMALTIVNEKGGTVIVVNPTSPSDVAGVIANVLNPNWSGRQTVA